MAGHRRHAIEPCLDPRIPAQLEPGLVRNVRVREERDVGEGECRTDKEFAPAKMPLHRRQRAIARGHPLLNPLGEFVGPPRIHEPEANDRDGGLMVVLLEEHPLEHLRPLVPIDGHKPCPFAEVPEDRSGLRQRAAVVEDDRRHAKSGVELAEQLVPIGSVDDVDGAPLVGNAEVREQEPHLVTVSRHRTVVQEHRPIIATCCGPAGSPRIQTMARYLHTMYRITDPGRSRSFYEALGFEFRREAPIERNGELEATLYFFAMPGQAEELELTFNHDGRTYETGSGYGHIAIGVDDLDATLAALSHQGIEPEKPPYRVREGGARLCFVGDPDGYRIEIIELSG